MLHTHTHTRTHTHTHTHTHTRTHTLSLHIRQPSQSLQRLYQAELSVTSSSLPFVLSFLLGHLQSSWFDFPNQFPFLPPLVQVPSNASETNNKKISYRPPQFLVLTLRYCQTVHITQLT